jgi:hypothetical protein
MVAAALSTNCGDDGSSPDSGKGGGGSSSGEPAGVAGSDAGGADSGLGGKAVTAGSTGEPEAGEPPGGGGSMQGGAPTNAGAGGAAPDDGVVARDQDAPTGIAVDAQNVYWGNSGAGTIVSCPLTGCEGEPNVIVETAGEVRGIAVDMTSVYWLVAPNQGLMAPIRKCPLTGCVNQPVTLGDVSSMRPNDVHVVGTVLYYTAWPDFGACTTTACATGDRTTLGATPVVSVDSFENFLYYSRYGNQIISRCERPACLGSVVDLVTGHHATSVAVDPTTLYFAESDFFGIYVAAAPGIFKCPIAGCGNDDPEPVVPGVAAFAIALSATRLYYTDVESGIVASVPK